MSVICVWPEPSAFMTQISSPRSNVIRRPSGDQSGSLSPETPFVSGWKFEPSALITAIWLLDRSSSYSATILWPSGEKDGTRNDSSIAPSKVSWVCPEPSVFMIHSCGSPRASRTKTIFVPSGEKPGEWSSVFSGSGGLANWTCPLPSAFMIQTRGRPPGSLRSKTIRSPSAE